VRIVDRLPIILRTLPAQGITKERRGFRKTVDEKLYIYSHNIIAIQPIGTATINRTISVNLGTTIIKNPNNSDNSTQYPPINWRKITQDWYDLRVHMNIHNKIAPIAEKTTLKPNFLDFCTQHNMSIPTIEINQWWVRIRVERSISIITYNYSECW